MRARSLTALAFTAVVLAVAPSGAQLSAAQVRSADDITKDLTPSASMLSGPTRGIRPVAPGEAARPAPQPVLPPASTWALRRPRRMAPRRPAV